VSVVSYILNSAAWAVAGYVVAMLHYRMRIIERLLKSRRDDDDEDTKNT
jgi:hypothetical protein